MYTIKAGDNVIYSPSLFLHGYVLIKPQLRSEINKASTLVFSAPVVNSRRSFLTMLKPEVKVYWDNTRVFRGRVITSERDFYLSNEVYCEGELAYLRDVIIRPYSRTESVSSYFTWIIGQYNAKVEASKRFVVGTCNVDGDSVKRENKEYPDALSEITDKLLNQYGGYLVPRCEVVNGAEVNYIDYLADPGTGTQKIQYAKNLLDLINKSDAAPVCTRFIPLGANKNGSRITIASVNSNRDYLANADAEAAYGVIEKVATFDEIDNPSRLKTEGQKAFADVLTPSISIDVNAIDLSVEGSANPLEVGKKYRLISVPHGFEGYLIRLTRAEINLQEPERSRYVFGRADAALSKTAVQTTRTASAVARLALQISESVNEIAEATKDYISNITTESGWTYREWSSGRASLERRQVAATVGSWTDIGDLKTAQATVTIPNKITSHNIQCTVTGGSAWLGSVSVSNTTLTAVVYSTAETSVTLDIILTGLKVE